MFPAWWYQGLALAVLATVGTITLPGCAKPRRIEIPEVALRTHRKGAYEFHRVADDPQGMGLRFPGFLVGMEKAPRRVVCACDKAKCRGVSLDSLEAHKPKRARRKAKRILNDPKRMFVSHVFHYDLDANNRIAPEALYSLYDSAGTEAEAEAAAKTAFRDSWTALQILKNAIAQEAEERDSTHLLFYVMGWNSGQQESLRNVNSLFGHLMAAKPTATRFRPLVVMLTWPSHWPVTGVDVGNKSNDADEVGLTWGGALLNNVILPVAKQHELQTVVIGHSFGARAVTRAAMSRGVFIPPPGLDLPAATSERKVDLLVSLQGGFSVNRFLDWKMAREGSPYLHHRDMVKRIVMTWSTQDRANTLAIWSRHSGGRRGYCAALKYSMSEDAKDANVFAMNRITSEGPLLEPLPSHGDPRIVYIDASKAVNRPAHRKSGRAHSDIYNQEVARMLWTLISKYAPGKQPADPSEQP